MRDFALASRSEPGPGRRRPTATVTGRPATLAAPDRDALTAGELLEIQRLAGNGAATTLVQREPDPTAAAPGGEPAPAPSAALSADDSAIADQAAAVIESADGPMPFHSLYADLDGEATFVVFDDVPVQRLFRLLLDRWGLSGDASENAVGEEGAPPWTGAFRAKALNVRAAAGYAGAQDEARLAGLAVRLADSVAAETPAQRIRRQLNEEIQARVGTVVMSQAAIDAERAKPAEKGLTPSNFTTCIAFFGQVMAQVSANAGLTGSVVKGPNSYKEIDPVNGQESLGDRWVPYAAGARPKPGDLLIFTFNEDEKRKDGSVKYGKGWFAHISILRAIEPMDDAGAGRAERWISVDGGGTTATETFRTFYPDTGVIVGPGTVTRRMKGWIDFEAAAEKGLAPKR